MQLSCFIEMLASRDCHVYCACKNGQDGAGLHVACKCVRSNLLCYIQSINYAHDIQAVKQCILKLVWTPSDWVSASTVYRKNHIYYNADCDCHRGTQGRAVACAAVPCPGSRPALASTVGGSYRTPFSSARGRALGMSAEGSAWPQL